MRTSISILIAVGVFSTGLVVRADDTTATPEPKRTAIIDAAYQNQSTADPQIVVSITKKAVQKTEDGKFSGGDIAAVAAFPVVVRSEAPASNESLTLPTAKAGLEYFNGKYSKKADSESAVNLVLRGIVDRDLGMGDHWSALAAVGVQFSSGSEDAPVGTLQSLPIQKGVSYVFTALAQAGAGQIDVHGPAIAAIIGLRVEEAVQYCKDLGDTKSDLLCAKLAVFQRVGTELGAGADGSIVYAHKIEEGAQKGYFFVAPTLGTEYLAPASDPCNKLNSYSAGGKIGVQF